VVKKAITNFSNNREGRMKRTLVLIITIGLIALMANAVYATTILYDVQNIGGDTWQYDYTVVNDSLTDPIREFMIYFDYGLYAALSVNSSATGWFEQTVDPAFVLGMPQDGFYDAIAVDTNPGILFGSAAGGFSVQFAWLFTGFTPAGQRFEVIDPATLAVLDSGQTAPIPEPGTVVLLLSGILGFAFWRRLSMSKPNRKD